MVEQRYSIRRNAPAVATEDIEILASLQDRGKNFNVGVRKRGFSLGFLKREFGGIVRKGTRGTIDAVQDASITVNFSLGNQSNDNVVLEITRGQFGAVCKVTGEPPV